MNEPVYNSNTPSSPLSINDLRELEGDARILDIRIAEIVEYAEPRMIRKLIKRNMPKLLKYGTCSTVEHVVRGNPVEEFWLNEGQALRIVTLSETEKADDATKQIIDTFIAYRKSSPPAEENRTKLLARALIEACKEIEENREDANAFRRIAQSEGSQNLTDTAKLLRMPRKDLIQWLREHKWIYRRMGAREWVGYDYHTKNGDLEHVLVEFEARGKTYSREHLLITVQGIAKLARIFGNSEAA